MSARDPWPDFAAEFADALTSQAGWSPEQLDAAAAEYQREQIATAQSETAQEQLKQEYSHAAHQR